MKISASLYSNKQRPLKDLVNELDRYRVDYLHIDCNDDLAVFDDILTIRKISKTPIDLHIISEKPSRFFNGIRDTGVDLVSFQYEPVTEELSIPSLPDTRFGIALTSGTPFSVFSNYKDQCDFLLFMTTTPGKSGGVFDNSNFARIRHFKSLFPDVKIHVDGGINDEVSFVLRNMGVSLVVSGSYLVNAEYPGAALHQLKSDDIDSHIRVSDFMIGRDESPVLVTGNFSFMNILQTIDNGKLGLAIVIADNGILEGIITNADVRKSLLINNCNISAINPDSVVNRNPFTVNADDTVTELLSKVKKAKFPVLYLPVTDERNRFCGVVTFTNLIKGED